MDNTLAIDMEDMDDEDPSFDDFPPGKDGVMWIDAFNVIFRGRWYRVIGTSPETGRVDLACFWVDDEGDLHRARSFITKWQGRLHERPDLPDLIDDDAFYGRRRELQKLHGFGRVEGD